MEVGHGDGNVADLLLALRRQRGKFSREIQGIRLERKEEDACGKANDM